MGRAYGDWAGVGVLINRILRNESCGCDGVLRIDEAPDDKDCMFVIDFLGQV